MFKELPNCLYTWTIASLSLKRFLPPTETDYTTNFHLSLKQNKTKITVDIDFI